MSTNSKKVGYYTLQFEKEHEFCFNKIEFNRLLDYLQNCPGTELIFKFETANKAISIDSMKKTSHHGTEYYEIIFKSCKYNHNPNYMSSLNGAERESDKRIDEGDKELTHVVIYVGDEECYVLKEERQQGVSISNIKLYLQEKIFEFNQTENFEFEGKLCYSTIESEDFLEMLEGASRIASLDLSINYKTFGSSFLNSSDECDTAIREEATLTIKAKRKENIAKKTVKNFYDKMIGKEVNRIRVRAKDDENNDMLLDTLNLNLKQYVQVEVDDKGIVRSGSILPQLRKLLFDYLENVQQI